jgi:hypothetical protein
VYRESGRDRGSVLMKGIKSEGVEG